MKLPDLSIDPAAKRRRVRIRAAGAIVALAALAAIAPWLLGVTGGTADRGNRPSGALRRAADPIAPVDLGTGHAPPQGAVTAPARPAALPAPPPVRPATQDPRPPNGTETVPASRPEGAGQGAGPMPASRSGRRPPSATARRIGARIPPRQHHHGRRRHGRIRHQSMPDPLADVAIDARVFGAPGR